LLKHNNVVEADFHAHAMRREFISRAIESSMNYATIRKQTGHHSTQAIEIYDEGLSTAPEIRAALDEHSSLIFKDINTGFMLSSGFSQEIINKGSSITKEDLTREKLREEKEAYELEAEKERRWNYMVDVLHENNETLHVLLEKTLLKEKA
jgi:hypothetical protein